jgi:hypothetical protein
VFVSGGGSASATTIIRGCQRAGSAMSAH